MATKAAAAAAAAAAATATLLVMSSFLFLAGAASANELRASSLVQKDMVPSSKSPEKCPPHAIKMAVCFRLLGGLIGGLIGKFPEQPAECCSLMGSMVDFETATCLCTAIRLNLIGMNLNLPIVFSLLNNFCGTKPPTGFQCF